MHILHVEDNLADIVLFRETLRSLSLSVELSVATNGEEALQILHRESPAASDSPVDLILLDLKLPRKSGFEVLAALQHDPERQFIPVVVFSSTANPQEVNRCYELGANAYMVKPLTLDAYVRKIQATVLFWQACQFRTLPE
jgi:CheY-like chemotaxis protein